MGLNASSSAPSPVMIVQNLEPFGCIFADPPWPYQNWTDRKNGAAASHYDGLTVEELASIPVDSWAAKKSILVLWGTWPKLPEALAVMEAWGFEYVTGFPWVKTVPSTGELRTGIGFWTQGMSECLFIGRRKGTKRRTIRCPDCEGEKARKKTCRACKGRGRVTDGPPAKGLLCGSEMQFYAPRGDHSKKPEEIQSWAERMIDGPYLELFATRPRDGWTTWGLALGYRLSSRGCERVEPDNNPFGAHGRRSAG